jgi:pimeloyl-ACP methyl ester carboxylesterase
MKPTRSSATVVLIHGIWTRAPIMWPLARRLRRAGFRVVVFSYTSVGRNLESNARRLETTISSLRSSTIHIVAHSLGGLLLRQWLHDFPRQRPGRYVTLGTPHSGSRVARGLIHHRIGHYVLGKSFDHGLDGNVPPWPKDRELGVIAGRKPLGLGRLLMMGKADNDGAVYLSETTLQGMRDYCVLNVTHTGMLFSRQVADSVRRFLREGRFK